MYVSGTDWCRQFEVAGYHLRITPKETGQSVSRFDDSVRIKNVSAARRPAPDISEEVWDAADRVDRELFFGRPSGSSMPLVWAHAEYLKLRRSLRDGLLFDLPPQTVRRYLTEKTESPRLVWRFNHKLRSMPPGKILRVETLASAIVHWSGDDWRTVEDVATRDLGLGVHSADLRTQALAEGSQVDFTFHWPDADRWEGENFAVRVVPDRGSP